MLAKYPTRKISDEVLVELIDLLSLFVVSESTITARIIPLAIANFGPGFNIQSPIYGGPIPIFFSPCLLSCLARTYLPTIQS